MGPGPLMGPARTDGRSRRRWPWIVGALLVLVGVAGVVGWLTASHARQVTLRQAETRLGSGGGGAPGASRPAPGVYAYTGTGTEQLSLPPLSQAEGPTMPGTVTLQGPDCWVLRIDYSTHHWQTWRYCLHGGDLHETGGQSWQLWPVGPLQFTNLTSFTCAAGSMALPANGSPGQTWASHCTGTNTSTKGRTVSAGPYRLVGTTTMSVGGELVRAAHFRRLRTDTGAQTGTERAEVWVDERTGLPLRLQQDIRVTASTAFGASTYTQIGVMTLTSLVPHR